METVHAGSPTKHPAQRLATIEAAGELKIPFTSGILVGIGETEEEQVASLEALAELHQRYGHLQEVILQNFVPHPKYYGAEVADIADEAARERWGDDGDPSAGAPHRGVEEGIEVGSLREFPSEGSPSSLPSWASPVRVEDIKRLIGECQTVDAGCGGSGAAESCRMLGGSWSRRVRPIWAGCRRTGITSRPSTRFRVRMRCARSWRRRGLR